MEIAEAKKQRWELEQKVNAMLNEFEKATGLEISEISFVRRGQFDDIGREKDFGYYSEIKIQL